MPKRIVAGVDGRQGGGDAAALAGALAAGGESDVLLAGVYPDPLLPFPLVLGRDLPLREQTEAVLRETRDAFARGARTHAVCDTFPARALRHLAQRERADVLVLGATHRARDGHAAAGRIARQVLHEAPCPVAIAARGLAREPVRLRRIVVGLDGSPEGELARAAAERLARDGARLELVSVVDDRLPTSLMPIGAALELTQWDEVIAARRTHAEQIVARAGAAIPDATSEVRVGDPAEELARAAEGADLLVVGSRRWGPLARIVVGSTVEDLLRAAPCSLLLVPRPVTAAEEEPPAPGETAPAAARGAA